jgi:hypothetical protein
VEIDFPGGQLMEVAADELVDIRMILAAALHFAETGEPASRLAWRGREGA